MVTLITLSTVFNIVHEVGKKKLIIEKEEYIFVTKEYSLQF